MPPHRHHCTIQHRLWLLEQVRIQRAAGLPLYPEEDFEEEEEEEEQEPAEEASALGVGKDEQEPVEEAPVLDVGEEEAPAMEENVDLRAEQQAILNSIRSESAADARRFHWMQMEATRAAADAAQAIADKDGQEAISDDDKE